MDSDCYQRRTDKLIEILKADDRLEEDVMVGVVVRMGRPESMMPSDRGHHVWVSWDGTAIVKNERWGGGSRQDHRATYGIWVVTCDYTGVDAAEEEFERLMANVGRVLADAANLQVANYWINLEQDAIDTGVREIEQLGKYWRTGCARFHMTFKEAIN